MKSNFYNFFLSYRLEKSNTLAREWTFDRKHISALNYNFNRNSNLNFNRNSYPNPKARKPF